MIHTQSGIFTHGIKYQGFWKLVYLPLENSDISCFWWRNVGSSWEKWDLWVIRLTKKLIPSQFHSVSNFFVFVTHLTQTFAKALGWEMSCGNILNIFSISEFASQFSSYSKFTTTWFCFSCITGGKLRPVRTEYWAQAPWDVQKKIQDLPGSIWRRLKTEGQKFHRAYFLSCTFEVQFILCY